MTILLWLELLSFPSPPQTSLEPSWNETLIYAAGQDWQFGKDIVFTYGPLGYLLSPFHLGATNASSRLAWELAGKFIFAAGLVAAIRRRHLLQQLIFVAACIWSGWIFGGSFSLIVIGIAVVEVLLCEGEGVPAKLACVFLLAFLAQLKFTNLVLAAAGVGFAGSYLTWIRRWQHGLVIAVGYCISLLIWWVIAGQHLENFIAYIRTGFAISSGYASAMGVDESNGVFVTGLAIVIGWFALVVQIAMRSRDRARSLASAGFVAFNAFTWWKYGFIRADAHTNSLYLATFLLAVTLPTSLIPEQRWPWFWIVGLIGLLGFRSNEPALFESCTRISCERIIDNAKTLTRIGSIREKWRHELNVAGSSCYLPATNKIVGSGSIDLVSFEQGLLLINGLNYSPRPVFQSYSAYVPSLARLNLDFYRSAAGPSFVLWREETIDSRFPTIDDAQLLPEIPRAYEARIEEGGFILLHKVHEMPMQALERTLIEERNAWMGEIIRVPEFKGTPIWVQAAFKLNVRGALRALLYKPPQIQMRVIDSSGAATTWRVLPEVAADGFLLAPLIENTSDFAAFVRGDNSKGVASIQFSAPGAQGSYWDSQLAVHFWFLPELKPNSHN